jgi:hypothetical protein
MVQLWVMGYTHFQLVVGSDLVDLWNLFVVDRPLEEVVEDIADRVLDDNKDEVYIEDMVVVGTYMGI